MNYKGITTSFTDLSFEQLQKMVLMPISCLGVIRYDEKVPYMYIQREKIYKQAITKLSSWISTSMRFTTIA